MRLASPRLSSLALVLAFVPAAACSSSGDDDSAGDDDGTPAIDAGDEPTVDASLDGFVELVGADFTIQPGTEPYRCARFTVAEDTYITALKDISPPGVHHTVLSVGSADGADGTYDCDVGDNEMQMLFASGVGSDAFEFPEGVAIKVLAGQQLKLNVHLFNASEAVVSGHAGSLVKLVPAAEIGDIEEAEMVFAGAAPLNIPSTGAPVTQQGHCSMKDGTLINLWPHMHQLATHIKVELGTSVLLDEGYTFSEQKNWPMTVALTEGQEMKVTCTYVNDTGSTVQWGESSTDEMCFAGFYRYPATGSNMICIEFP